MVDGLRKTSSVLRESEDGFLFPSSPCISSAQAQIRKLCSDLHA